MKDNFIPIKLRSTPHKIMGCMIESLDSIIKPNKYSHIRLMYAFTESIDMQKYPIQDVLPIIEKYLILYLEEEIKKQFSKEKIYKIISWHSIICKFKFNNLFGEEFDLSEQNNCRNYKKKIKKQLVTGRKIRKDILYKLYRFLIGFSCKLVMWKLLGKEELLEYSKKYQNIYLKCRNRKVYEHTKEIISHSQSVLKLVYDYDIEI